MKNEQATKLALFTNKAESLLNQLDWLFSHAMVNDGDTAETSQRMALVNALNEVEQIVNGVIASDILGAYTTFENEQSKSNEERKLIATAINVTGAVVSAKTRHQNNRQKLTVSIPKTQLYTEYWGEGIARNRVRKELNKQGLNSCFKIISWICQTEQKILMPDVYDYLFENDHNIGEIMLNDKIKIVMTPIEGGDYE